MALNSSCTVCLKTRWKWLQAQFNRVSQNDLEMPLNQGLQGDSKRDEHALNSTFTENEKMANLGALKRDQRN